MNDIRAEALQVIPFAIPEEFCGVIIYCELRDGNLFPKLYGKTRGLNAEGFGHIIGSLYQAIEVYENDIRQMILRDGGDAGLRVMEAEIDRVTLTIKTMRNLSRLVNGGDKPT